MTAEHILDIYNILKQKRDTYYVNLKNTRQAFTQKYNTNDYMSKISSTDLVVLNGVINDYNYSKSLFEDFKQTQWSGMNIDTVKENTNE